MYEEVKYEALKTKLVVNKLRLDDEQIELSQWQQDAGETYIAAQKYRDEVKQYVSVVEASVAHDMRFPADDSKSPSEKSIESQLPLSEPIQEAKQKLIDAEADAQLWRLLCDNLRTKGHAIRTIVDLMGAGYISASSVSAQGRVSTANRPQSPPAR